MSISIEHSPDGPGMLAVIKSSLENDFGMTPRTNGTSEGRSTRRSSLPIFEHPSGLIFRKHNYLTGGTPSLSERCPASLNCWPSFPLYAFTNSNREHEQYWSKQFSGILGNFKEIYVSSTIGSRKPEAEAYDYVVRAIGVSAERIVFFDDTLENIEGARARGLQAVHVESGADLADALAVLIERSRAVEERSR
jgi:hypothetical protein